MNKKVTIEEAKQLFKKYIEDDIAEVDRDKDVRHRTMDLMLLEIIGDDELSSLFNKVFKYYI